jgi:hypothetical protein
VIKRANLDKVKKSSASDFAHEITAGFQHLNITDLLEAREQYHVFLMRHPNVVATAIGKYLIREADGEGRTKKGSSPSRTLSNSRIHAEQSWPCILVFVDQWQSAAELMDGNPSNAVLPTILYLPDGRAVPVCIVLAERQLETQDAVLPKPMRFPSSVLSPGYPVHVSVQGVDRFATVGCLVTDGSRYYGLTNRHVCGEPGRIVSANLGTDLVQIGVSAPRDLQLSKLPFDQVYPDWPGQHLSINADVGLIDLDDINSWRADMFSVGAMGPIADLNVNSLNLSVIGMKVKGFGAASGKIEGLVSALFYRYRSIGGIEYVSDFLIGPSSDESSVVRHGDSGAVLSLETPQGLRPFSIVWGAHDFVGDGDRASLGFALATGLGNVCRLLDVDLVRGWNVDAPYTWGKTGHFKIGYHAADLVSNAKLVKLLSNNQDSLGYSNDALVSQDTVEGKFTHDFVPLADVADIIWRTTRPDDEPNHFSDIDESNASVYGGKTLLELSLEDDANIDVDTWIDFDQQMDKVSPNFGKDGSPRPREGGLPFRVWQMYKQMIASLQAGKVDEFIVAGGTMAHYVGDACQPLHISYLHHGATPAEAPVHADYETKLIDMKASDLFDGVDAIKTKVSDKELIGPNGKEAAKLVLNLMKATVDLLPPAQIVEVWRESKGRGKWDKMWEELGARTITNVAAGSHAMAVLWQSAWVNGNGDRLPATKLAEIPQTTLQKLYSNKNFVPSFRLSDPEGYKTVL